MVENPSVSGPSFGCGPLLRGARVYLSGPMDFVASREEEMKNGWRARIGHVLRDLGAIVFDPWHKPDIKDLHEYGKETPKTVAIRDKWTFDDDVSAAETRAWITGHYWPTLHIDLRMVDTADFVVAFCPTNIYSVGTPHEIATARLERKPVLLVSPPVVFPTFEALRSHLMSQKDDHGTTLLSQLEQELPLKPNPRAVPSLWYMPLVGGESFFDGFGFCDEQFRTRYGWREMSPLDERESAVPPSRPLLPYLIKLSHGIPKKWDNKYKRYIPNDDWLLWDIRDNSVEEPHAD